MSTNKILIVDDDVSTINLIKFLLERLGYKNVGSAINAPEAIRKARETVPDIVLMDIKLDGDMDGIEAGKLIYDELNVPIIYITSHEDDVLFQRAKITEPYGYIIKPFNERDLHIAVEIAIHRHGQETRITELREYANNIINSSLDMIIACDIDRKIIEFNRAAEAAFGYKKNEVLGKHINMIYGHPDRGLEVHNKTIKNGRCVEDVSNKKKNGELFTSQLAASILVDSNGNRVGVMGISHDITELKKTREALKNSELRYRRLSEELANSNSLKKMLLDIIAHDLKNSAGVIAGMADLLISENEDSEEIQLIKESSTALLKILETTSTLTQLEIGDKIEREELNLAKMINEICSEFKSSLTDHKIELKIKLAPDLRAVTNPIIGEIFRNYINNTIKYAGRGSKLTISSKQNDEYITINFTDTGKTIAKEFREKIFERRMQVEPGSNKGRGLGLAIAKRIAEALNSEVGVKPSKPQGNIFYYRCPS